MKNNSNQKKLPFLKVSGLLFLFVALISFSSCKKEGCTDNTATNYNSEAKKDDGSCVYPPVFCLTDSLNGTYEGAGNLNGIPSTDMTVVFTKLSCTTGTIKSGAVTENVVDISESSLNNYIGTDGDGNGISFSFSIVDLTVESDNISFTGSK